MDGPQSFSVTSASEQTDDGTRDDGPRDPFSLLVRSKGYVETTIHARHVEQMLLSY